MPSFTIIARVELHKDDARTRPHSPDAGEYQTLHAEMWQRGFRRYFEGASGKLRKLPPGEYYIRQQGSDGDAASDAAMKKIRDAATIATSKDRFSIVFTCDGKINSFALQVISKDPDA